MMKENDNRSICSDSKRNAIKAARFATANRRKDQVVKSYELKINKKRLNKKQISELDKLFIEGKWFYNYVLNLHQNGINLKDINSTNITEVKHFDKDKNEIVSRLEQISSQQKQAVITRMISNEKTICKLVKKGLQKYGNLRFKSELNCIPLKQYGNSYKFKSDNKVKIQGISGKILVRGIKQFNRDEVEFANANLLRKPDGYYLKVVTYINKEKIKQQKKNNRILGLDFGIKTNITTSEGNKINISIEESEQLKSLQQKMQRQKKGSNNRYKTIKKIRIAYQKQNQKKQDIANKFIHDMKTYDRVIYQDEQIAKWHEEKRMSKIVQHSCLGLIKSKLSQLDNSVKLDKFIPTTKWCPKCGTKNEYLTLNDRTFHCGCGHSEDRDIHAAKNMVTIWKSLVENNLVPMDGREVKLVDWQKYQDDTRRCSVFS